MVAFVDAATEKFVVKARNYFVFLLETFFASWQTSVFCLYSPLTEQFRVVMIAVPIDQATFCFSALYLSFKIRRWLANVSNEYLAFLDHFHIPVWKTALRPLLTFLVSFLLQMPELRTRRHLFYVFRLSCLRITVRAPDLPAFNFPGMDSGVPRSRLYDVIKTAQSYLANVSNSETFCTTEASLSIYRDLETWD